MKHVMRMALCAAFVAACRGRGPIGGTGSADAAAGSSGSAGTSGAAGTSTVGTGAAGTAAAGTTGIAGTSGLPPGCAPFGDTTLPSGRCAFQGFKRDGVCQCQDTAPNVCADTCVDVRSDPENCGCCGHACAATAACIPGSPPTSIFRAPIDDASDPERSVEIARGQLGPRSVAVDDQRVYWSTSACAIMATTQ